MKRRKLLGISLTGGVAIVTGGYWWLQDGIASEKLSVEYVVQRLDGYASYSLLSSGIWTPAQIFLHCAQSVDYSMDGFPEHKSDVFKRTLGSAVFAVFSSKGKMIHNLAETIPSAPRLDPAIEVQDAIARLKKSLNRFQNFRGKLAPHFAYGELSKDEYRLAHVMHLHNHFEEIVIS